MARVVCAQTFGEEMKSRTMMRRVWLTLSAIFHGIFAAPLLSLIWFAVPWLRYFPVGDDSPHAIALPLGFLGGIAVATQLNKLKWWWIVAIVFGATFFVLSGYHLTTEFIKTRRVDGWYGLRSLFACLILLHAVVSGLGLLVAGVFSWLGRRDRHDIA